MTTIDLSYVDIQKLQSLGLTLLQAKVYLILVRGGTETTLAVSNKAHVDRSNTYRAILQLQDMGLVTKILGVPNSYQAIPFKNAVLTLLSRKKTEYDKVQATAQELMQKRIKKIAGTNPEKGFVLEKWTREIYQQKIIICTETASDTIDLMINKKTFIGGVIDLAKYQLACVKRGVRYRIITESSYLCKDQKKLEPFLAEPNFQFRILPQNFQFDMTIVDKKNACIFLVPDVGMNNTTVLITYHPACIEVFQSHFDKEWNQAQEYKLKK
jgi:sugar-specific transcriptional regulator TrmB